MGRMPPARRELSMHPGALGAPRSPPDRSAACAWQGSGTASSGLRLSKRRDPLAPAACFFQHAGKIEIDQRAICKFAHAVDPDIADLPPRNRVGEMRDYIVERLRFDLVHPHRNEIRALAGFDRPDPAAELQCL